MHYLIQQVEAGIGFAVKDGNITLFAVHGEEYLPALCCPFHGIAVCAEIAGTEVIQVFGISVLIKLVL